MNVIHDLHWCPPFQHGSVMTFGDFDGMHRGHRVVISELCRVAAIEGCPTVVVTFDGDTTAGLDDAPIKGLIGLDEKLRLLASSGVDNTVVIPAVQVTEGRSGGDADQERSHDSIVEWLIEDIFHERLRARAVVVGDDEIFGPRRRSTVAAVQDHADRCGYNVERVPLSACVTRAGELISSTSIRLALTEGNVELAGEMLGRSFDLIGTVIEGDRRGRTIGFPTANVSPEPDKQAPADGVYAAFFRRPDGSVWPAAVNVGKRPTFVQSAGQSLVEAHLIGFRGDLYGETARVSFVRRLRSETKFDGIDQLVEQLARDVNDASIALSA